MKLKLGLISFSALALMALPVTAMAQTTSTSAQGTSVAGSEAIVAPTTNEYNSGTETIHNNTQAPDLVVSGANVCAMPVGGSLSLLGTGGGVAMTALDHGCEVRANASALWQMGYRPAATMLMCSDKDVAKAMAATHTPCDGSTPPDNVAVSQVPAKVEQVAVNPMAVERAKFCASLSPKNRADRPYIAQCLANENNG
jgi:hypothetical protein